VKSAASRRYDAFFRAAEWQDRRRLVRLA
jgi:hypothetical protein